MNKYLATVRVKGQLVRTMVFADSSLHARLILEFQFGIGSVATSPTISTRAIEQFMPLDEVLATIKPIKPTAPANPQQARIDALKKQKSAITKNLDAERKRQKIAKAQQQIRTASQKIL
jgi:hypothetical protein